MTVPDGARPVAPRGADPVAPRGADPVAPRGATSVAAVIGDPVRHSLSPVLHNAAFAAAGLDWVYVALPVPAGRAAAALDAMRWCGVAGLSVTMPHKEAIAELLAGRLSAAAQRLGAVNCVRRAQPDGSGPGAPVELVGENTDGGGFVDALRHEHGVDPAGASVAVVGAGGAGRAVALALADAGAERIVIVNRGTERARQALAVVGGRAVLGTPDDVGSVDIVVNATSVGMGQAPERADLPFDADRLRAEQLVADLVYQPIRTGLLVEAERRGARTLNGVGMLLHQAARAYTLWTGQAAPVNAMRGAVLSQLAI